jgi:hypothetical protein
MIKDRPLLSPFATVLVIATRVKTVFCVARNEEGEECAEPPSAANPCKGAMECIENVCAYPAGLFCK